MIPLQDYLIHYILRFADESKIPIQVHTGLQEGYGNYITNADPTLLLGLFNEYKRVRFDIFHGGYPYCNELVAIVKNFQNVYANLAWLHIISLTAARLYLHQLIEAVPSNKVFGFGGDYIFIGGMYGHLQIAKENIARVLFEKVQEEYFSEKEEIDYARKMLYDNAKDFYNL